MYWDDAQHYVKFAGEFEKDNYRMLLAIATNPHLAGPKQRELWSSLTRGKGKALTPRTEEEIKAMLEGDDSGI